ncbi:hypothetical protein [Chryseobacterium sp. Leaf394]|uniref:hypothetical protein n=1 Tax=Chryseobacterium sp. Leaf394 TaxID=1736361 RepID=UPI000AF3A1C4|nr:hypothetical protein [Chryseobacterium sp. Leaf394]
MKNLLSIFILTVISSVTFTSCNDDDDYETIQLVEKVKIDSVSIVNDTMNVFDIQSIRTYQKFTQQCEGFYGYDYVHTADFDRNVTAYKFKNQCQLWIGNFHRF